MQDTKDNSGNQAGRSPRERAEDYNKDFEDKTPTSDLDNAAESLGKAVTAPMRDAADEGSHKVPGEGNG